MVTSRLLLMKCSPKEGNLKQTICPFDAPCMLVCWSAPCRLDGLHRLWVPGSNSLPSGSLTSTSQHVPWAANNSFTWSVRNLLAFWLASWLQHWTRGFFSTLLLWFFQPIDDGALAPHNQSFDVRDLHWWHGRTICLSSCTACWIKNTRKI